MNFSGGPLPLFAKLTLDLALDRQGWLKLLLLSSLCAVGARRSGGDEHERCRPRWPSAA